MMSSISLGALLTPNSVHNSAGRMVFGNVEHKPFVAADTIKEPVDYFGQGIEVFKRCFWPKSVRFSRTMLAIPGIDWPAPEPADRKSPVVDSFHLRHRRSGVSR